MLPFFKHVRNNDGGSSAYLDFEREAIVEEVIQQGRKWRVYYDNTSWNARCSQSIVLQPGDTVYVVGMQNITLIIEPTYSANYQDKHLEGDNY